MLPSTYYAASASDLIADINAANRAGGANTIVLTAPTTSPYVLTAVNNTTDGVTGLPVISSGGRKAENLTIIGNGDTIERSTASGTPAFRLFDVAKAASLTLQNVTLQNGLEGYGSGVWAEGGAIYNQGTLVLNSVLIQNNVAEGSPGSSPTKKNPASPGSDAAGGGLWSNGILTLENSVIQGNSALGGQSDSPGFGGNAFGGGIYIAGGTANITGTTFSFNHAQGGSSSFYAGSNGGSADGGAVYVAGGTVTLSADVFGTTSYFGPPPIENTAYGGDDRKGSGLYGNGNGGALYVAGGSVTLTNDYVISNQAAGYEYPTGGPYTGGIFIASGATVYLDAFTVNNTYQNSTYTDLLGGGFGNPELWDNQIVGTYILLS